MSGMKPDAWSVGVEPLTRAREVQMTVGGLLRGIRKTNRVSRSLGGGVGDGVLTVLELRSGP